MVMFGGFGKVLQRYHKLIPPTEPADEYDDRISLYAAYHELNHAGMFGGGGYRSSAMSTLQRLIRQYG